MVSMVGSGAAIRLLPAPPAWLSLMLVATTLAMTTSDSGHGSLGLSTATMMRPVDVISSTGDGDATMSTNEMDVGEQETSAGDQGQRQQQATSSRHNYTQCVQLQTECMYIEHAQENGWFGLSPGDNDSALILHRVLIGLQLFIGRFNHRHQNSSSSSSSDGDGDGVMGTTSVTAQSLSSCTDLSDVEILCSVLTESNDTCMPVTDAPSALSGLCLEAWHIQLVLLPSVSQNSRFVYFLHILARIYCSESSQLSNVVRDCRGDLRNVTVSSAQECSYDHEANQTLIKACRDALLTRIPSEQWCPFPFVAVERSRLPNDSFFSNLQGTTVDNLLQGEHDDHLIEQRLRELCPVDLQVAVEDDDTSHEDDRDNSSSTDTGNATAAATTVATTVAPAATSQDEGEDEEEDEEAQVDEVTILRGQITADILGVKKLLDDLTTSRGSKDTLIEELEGRIYCARHCNVERAYSQRTTRTFIAYWAAIAFLALTVLPLLVVVSGICSGFKAMWEYPSRLMLYLAAAVFFYGAYLLPAFLELLSVRSISCNADMTSATSADLKRNPLASYSCAINTFGVFLFRFMTLFVSAAWWQLAVKLQLWTKSRWYAVDIQGWGECIGIAIVLAATTIITGISTNSNYHTNQLVHICVDGTSDKVRYAIELTATILSFICIGDGCRRLIGLYRKSKRFQGRHTSMAASQRNAVSDDNDDTLVAAEEMPNNGTKQSVRLQQQQQQQQQQRRPKRSVAGNSRNTSKRANSMMVELMRRIVFFFVGIFVAGTTIELSLYFVSTLSESDIEKVGAMFTQYAKCTRVTCGNTDLCSPLLADVPSHIYTLYTCIHTLNILCALLLCGGVLSPLAWRRKLSIKEKARERRRRLATSTRRTQSTRLSKINPPTTTAADSELSNNSGQQQHVARMNGGDVSRGKESPGHILRESPLLDQEQIDGQLAVTPIPPYTKCSLSSSPFSPDSAFESGYY